MNKVFDNQHARAKTAAMLQLLTHTRSSTQATAEVWARFEAEDTAVYGHSMPRWTPDHDEVWHLMIEAIRPYITAHSQLLDLGAGTGRIAHKLLAAFDSIHILLTDYSANMLSGATQALIEFEGRFATQTADFFSHDLAFADNSFDCVYSTFALHHGREVSDYGRLYNKIHRWLKPGGCFICCDHVLGATDYLTALNMAQWHHFMAHSFDEATCYEIIESTYLEDTPLTLAQHLALLRAAGFTAVDILWKKQIFGLYMGIKDE